MPENKIKNVVNFNKYILRNRGFILTFIIQLIILLTTIINFNLTENQFKIFDSLIASCYFYQISYLTNNAADLAIKKFSERKVKENEKN